MFAKKETNEKKQKQTNKQKTTTKRRKVILRSALYLDKSIMVLQSMLANVCGISEKKRKLLALVHCQ